MFGNEVSDCSLFGRTTQTQQLRASSILAAHYRRVAPSQRDSITTEADLDEFSDDEEVVQSDSVSSLASASEPSKGEDIPDESCVPRSTLNLPTVVSLM